MEQKWRAGKRVAIVGAGPGGVSAALAFLQRGFDVRLYEKQPEPKPLGGAVLLSSPVLAVLRSYGIDTTHFGAKTKTYFKNAKGKTRVLIPFNKKVENALGIDGWHYGVLRASAFKKMLDLVPSDAIYAGHEFQSYTDRGNEVDIEFTNGETVTADILIGSDGVRSGVSKQAFGDPGLFHVGLRVWLAWCHDIPDLPKDVGVLHHGRKIQASYFPMLHDGKPGFEWWIVEPVKEGAQPPANEEAYIRKLLSGFADPMQRFPDHTDFKSQIFRWDIYNRPSLNEWSKGRVVCLGDAVHPVSPYAAYGMGMAIEDGYFLARSLKNVDLTQSDVVTRGFKTFEGERLQYVNHNVEFARFLGNRFHQANSFSSWFRDMVFDHTKILQKMVEKDYLSAAERMSLQLKELHVDGAGKPPPALAIPT